MLLVAVFYVLVLHSFQLLFAKTCFFLKLASLVYGACLVRASSVGLNGGGYSEVVWPVLTYTIVQCSASCVHWTGLRET